MPRIYFTPDQLPYKLQVRSDITGRRFNRLVVIKVVGKYYHPNGAGYALLWRCQCDCGQLTDVATRNMVSGKTKSCGCHNRARITTHGLAASRVYKTWTAMIARCHNSSHPSYCNYGERGITVCDKWRKFIEFYKDMGDHPSGRSLERVDNSKGYSPDNCIWATRAQQSVNKRSTRLIEFQGKKLAISEWSTITGLKRGTIEMRIRLGWATEQVLTFPPKKGRQVKRWQS